MKNSAIRDLDFKSLIAKIVSAIDINKDEIVLLQLWGNNAYYCLLDNFTIEIAKKGGKAIRWHNSREFISQYYNEVDENNLSYPDKFFQIFEIADKVIDIITEPIGPNKDFPKDKFKYYAEYMKSLFKILSRKETFVQIRLPSDENAQASGLDHTLYKKKLYNALNCDYIQIKKDADRLLSKVKGTQKVEIHTGKDYKLCFELGQRKWYRDDGMGDFPCGEIYIAPLEESADGEIVIPKIFLSGNEFKNTYFRFNSGKIVECSSEELMEFLDSQKGDSTRLAEFGIGLNRKSKEIIGLPLIDEKIYGTMHIAVGNNLMFGGTNNSSHHRDFIFRPEKVLFDNEPVNLN